MLHKATRRFWHAYHALPEEIRVAARDAYRLVRDNPRHSSLRFKCVGKFWSARVTRDYRAVAIHDGQHDEYDRFIRS